MPLTGCDQEKDEHKRGTIICFKPDPTIFETIDFDYDKLSYRMRELAFLNKGISITIVDERTGGDSDTFHYEGGVSVNL